MYYYCKLLLLLLTLCSSEGGPGLQVNIPDAVQKYTTRRLTVVPGFFDFSLSSCLPFAHIRGHIPRRYYPMLMVVLRGRSSSIR